MLPALLRGYRGACAGCPSSQPLRGSLRWGVSAPWYLGEGGLASSTWGSVLPSSPHWRAPGRRHMEKLPLRSGLRAREGITVSGEQHSRTRGPWPVALLCVSRQRPPSCPAPRRGSSARPPDPLTGDLDDARAPAACLSSASGPRPLTQQPRWAPSEVTAPSRSPPPSLPSGGRGGGGSAAARGPPSHLQQVNKGSTVPPASLCPVEQQLLVPLPWTGHTASTPGLWVFRASEAVLRGVTETWQAASSGASRLIFQGVG